MTAIKFGTDGWRAIIAKDFTTDNVKRISMGVALYLKQKETAPSVVIGHDCRFAGELFMQTAASVFLAQGIKVHFAQGFVSTPMISLAAHELQVSMGVIITASHNPPSYNGYKLKGNYGGPVLPAELEQIEALIPDAVPQVADIELKDNGTTLFRQDLEAMYIKRVEESFDLDAIRNSSMKFAYDAMYGAGQGVMKKLFPGMDLLHCDQNPGFEGTAPEPILKNLKPFQEFIRSKGNIASGLATDGDADRIGLFDSKGNFVDSHHIILLLIHYLYKYKGYRGKVITAFSVTDKVKTLCRHYGLEQQTVKIGFKYIAGFFLEEDILLGGEESGGIAVKGHIPERDGIWMGLIIWEFMAKSGKTLEELIEEVYAITGSFQYDRADLHLTEEQKQRILKTCAGGNIQHFGGKDVARTETIDGYKYHFNGGEWLMIRASGTEPVVRVYAEAADKNELETFLEQSVKDVLAL